MGVIGDTTQRTKPKIGHIADIAVKTKRIQSHRDMVNTLCLGSGTEMN